MKALAAKSNQPEKRMNKDTRFVLSFQQQELYFKLIVQ
jgi:hypothetical protein